MSFSDPRWLWMLLALPALALLEWRAVSRARRRLARLAGPRADSALLAQRLPGQRRLGLLLRLVAIAALIVGAAGPEWGTELTRRAASGSDVVFVIDVSASMDARDVAPSRLEEARREALAALDRLQGSKIGVVAFAGEAIRLCPLTIDRSAARLVIESLTSGSVSEPGTDIGKALRAAARMLPNGRRSEQAIVLWTDGEDLEGGARGALEDVVTSGLRLFTVGVGTPAGDVVPVLDDQSRAVDIKRDADGGPVRSRLDENLLRELARRTRGGYFSASQAGGESARLVATLSQLAHGSRGERLVERAVPRFPLCAGAAALLLAIDLARRHRRGERRAAPLARTRRVAAAAVLAVLALVPAGNARAQSAWARGDRAFRDGQWRAADSLYTLRARRRAPGSLGVDLGTARARAGKVDEGIGLLRQRVLDPGRTGQMADYNLGTLLAEKGDLDGALRALRRAIERTPGDEDARWNYEWAQRKKTERQQRQQSPRPQQQPQQQQQQQQQPQQPQPQPQQQQPQQPRPGQAPPPAPTPAPQMGQHLDKQQADRILASLQQLERLEQQRLRQVRVVKEKRGKDW